MAAVDVYRSASLGATGGIGQIVLVYPMTALFARQFRGF